MEMLFTCHKQSTSVRSKGRNEYTRIKEKPDLIASNHISPKIHRLQESAGENIHPQIKANSRETGQNRELSSNPEHLNMKESTETDSVNASTPIKDGLPKFGPFYYNNDHVFQEAREEAWLLVLRKTDPNINSSEAQEKIKQDYMSAMRNVQKEAIDAYAGNGSLPVKGSDFLWMMIKDGCFFLQLALVILGGAKLLGHPPDHVIFSNQQNSKKITMWLDAMFFAGNQIPLIVLQELMKQSFFHNVIAKGEWVRPSVLSKRILYELLVLPSLDIRSPEKSFILPLMCCKGRSARSEKDCHVLLKDIIHQPCDVLQGLRSMILGPSIEPEEFEPDEIDLEANWKQSTSEEKRKINATSLKKAGITIKHIQGVGIRGISFEETYYGANLYLPTFTVEDDTEMTLKNLKTYEMNQPGAKNNREVCSYLRFMGDIICTLEDVKLLAKKGIIQGSKKEIDKLPGIMRRLECMDLTHHLYNVKLHIGSYSAPAWVQYVKYVMNLVALLTLIQTMYTVLSFHHSSKC
ncbi:hypothetical protein BUALT_Bualt14G0053900 [Buddleja alternifolia]|uniref:Uncharacterized protein n=1 Tax=Buddleja alternifolia TaxID=168488 RepID=A0AAV6WGF9_9LAMI|nr:hypothetical protein BUALT_Bualt14G0053900 [Buddleja alternifolia]